MTMGGRSQVRLTAQSLAGLAQGGNEFRRDQDGHAWIVAYDGRLVHLPDAKGLHDLWMIIGAHGAEVHVMTLLGVAVPYVPTGADPVLDARARAEYKARIAHLDCAIDDAEDIGDATRADGLRAERSAIIRELANATGLGGRDRRLGAETERARKTVSARVRDSLRRIERVHPTLAAHLRTSIRMGAACAYHPPDPVPLATVVTHSHSSADSSTHINVALWGASVIVVERVDGTPVTKPSNSLALLTAWMWRHLIAAQHVSADRPNHV